MADEIDQTSDVEQSLLELRIKDIRSRGRELEPIGECHNCGEPFEADSLKLYCDSECAQDHDKYVKRGNKDADYR